jgi:hypothetical protein
VFFFALFSISSLPAPASQSARASSSCRPGLNGSCRKCWRPLPNGKQQFLGERRFAQFELSHKVQRLNSKSRQSTALVYLRFNVRQESLCILCLDQIADAIWCAILCPFLPLPLRAPNRKTKSNGFLILWFV